MATLMVTIRMSDMNLAGGGGQAGLRLQRVVASPAVAHRRHARRAVG